MDRSRLRDGRFRPWELEREVVGKRRSWSESLMLPSQLLRKSPAWTSAPPPTSAGNWRCVQIKNWLFAPVLDILLFARTLQVESADLLVDDDDRLDSVELVSVLLSERGERFQLEQCIRQVESVRVDDRRHGRAADLLKDDEVRV